MPTANTLTGFIFHVRAQRLPRNVYSEYYIKASVPWHGLLLRIAYLSLAPKMMLDDLIQRLDALRVAPEPTVQSAQDILHPAVPVEEVERQIKQVQAGIPCMLGEDSIQGLSVCHSCGHENPLIHQMGAHCFGYLRCENCDHVFCELCPASAVLTRIADKYSRLRYQKPRGTRYVPILTVCK
jgi:hypothetical protein